MSESSSAPTNNYYIDVSGSGIPEVDGLFVPSTAPPAESESGTRSAPGYWNGKMAWDRADGKSARSPALSYSNSYRSWRICRLDGHLAYHIVTEDELPPTDPEWEVYKKGVAPAPKVVLHHFDPREPCPAPNVVFVLGGPGSGKGTMCELAESQLGWSHLSTGDLLRRAREAGGPESEKIESHITAGELVPNEIMIPLLTDAMEHTTRTTGRTNFLLDGFPRSVANVDAWQERFGQPSDPAGLPTMLVFECPYEVLEARILGRAKYTGRSDDNLESIKQRVETFKAETLPLVTPFEQVGKCVRIDASQDRQVVYAEVKRNLSSHTAPTLIDKPLSERAEMLLGLRPFPKKKT